MVIICTKTDSFNTTQISNAKQISFDKNTGIISIIDENGNVTTLNSKNTMISVTFPFMEE